MFNCFPFDFAQADASLITCSTLLDHYLLISRVNGFCLSPCVVYCFQGSLIILHVAAMSRKAALTIIGKTTRRITTVFYLRDHKKYYITLWGKHLSGDWYKCPHTVVCLVLSLFLTWADTYPFLGFSTVVAARGSWESFKNAKAQGKAPVFCPSHDPLLPALYLALTPL